VPRSQRITRKDLRQPDEFLTLSRRAGAWVGENRTAVLTAAGAVVVVLVAVIAYRAIGASREAGAARAYYAAQALATGQKYEEAAKAFREVVDGYGGTEHAALARLQEANALLQAGRPAEAAVAYERFLDAGAPADYLRQLAQTRLAYTAEARGESAAALAAYAAATDTAELFAGDALLGEARAAEALGDTAKARTLYERYLEKYPASDRSAVASARLVALGGTPPAPAEKAPAAAEQADS